MEIKVCGITLKNDILLLEKFKIDRLGFIFYNSSPRDVSNLSIIDTVRSIPTHIKKVGVFVNSEIKFISSQIDDYKLDSVQLHGNESPDFCMKLNNKAEVIKSFSVRDESSFNKCKLYYNVCDYFLFDTYTSSYGGSGKQFDWNLLDSCDINKPFFLSGGIDLASVNRILKIKNSFLAGIDVNSKFELSPGKKDLNKIDILIKQLKQ